MLGYFESILPYTNGGKLPYWLVYFVVSIFNSVQTYQNINLTKRVYEKIQIKYLHYQQELLELGH